MPCGAIAANIPAIAPMEKPLALRRPLFLMLALVGACEGTAPVTAGDTGAIDATKDAAEDAAEDAAVDAGVAELDVPPDRVRVVPTTWPPSPPPMPTYSRGACPTLRAGPGAAAGLNADFPTGAARRQFRLIVPASYDPAGADRWTLLVAWHWLAGDSGQLVREGDIEAAAARYRMIVAVPDQQREADGRASNYFTWPFILSSRPEAERIFLDDMLACVTAQYRVDPARVHAMGVSAGALWLTSLLSTPYAQRFASVAILSGGLGYVPNVLRLEYEPQPNKFPALVVWGGPSDRLLVDFDDASRRLRDALVDDGHFVIACTHDRGHALPPLVAPAPDEPRSAFVWRFFLDHPYGRAPATSPYLAAGLPPGAPSWCGIPPEIVGR